MFMADMLTRKRLIFIAIYIAVLSAVVYARGLALAGLISGRYRFSSFLFDVIALGLILILLHIFSYGVRRAVAGIIKPKTRARKLVTGLLHFGIVVFIAGPFLFAAIQLHPQKVSPKGTPADAGLKNYTDVSFYSDGIRLSGWFIPAGQSKKPVILVTHGLGVNKENFLKPVAMVHQLGYNALICDFRAHGDSGGYLTTFGIKESRDIKAAYDWITRTCPGVPVYALSYSMGGSAVIRAAAEYGIFNRIVIDASFGQLETVARAKVLKNFGPLATPVWYLSRFWGWVWTGVDIADNQPEKLMPRLDGRRVMIIHGTADSFIPYTESIRLYEATNRKAQLWLVDGADHVQSMDQPEYKTRLKSFYGD